MDSVWQLVTALLLIVNTTSDQVPNREIATKHKANIMRGRKISLFSANAAQTSTPAHHLIPKPCRTIVVVTPTMPSSTIERKRTRPVSNCEIMRTTLGQRALDVMMTIVISSALTRTKLCEVAPSLNWKLNQFVYISARADTLKIFS